MTTSGSLTSVMFTPAPDESNQRQGFPTAPSNEASPPADVNPPVSPVPDASPISEPVVQTLPSMRDLEALEVDLNQIDTTLAELDRTQVGAS